jgi:hypothetical protein
MILDLPFARETAELIMTDDVLPLPVGPKRAQFVWDMCFVNAFEPVTLKPWFDEDRCS